MTWTKASDLAKFAINRSGVSAQVDAEKILQITNILGKENFHGISFREGLLVIAAKDADPVTLQADRQKIKNYINKTLKFQKVKSIKVISS